LLWEEIYIPPYFGNLQKAGDICKEETE